MYHCTAQSLAFIFEIFTPALSISAPTNSKRSEVLYGYYEIRMPVMIDAVTMPVIMTGQVQPWGGDVLIYSLSTQPILLPTSLSRSLSLSPSFFWSLCLSGRVVFRIPDWLHHLLMAGRILLKNTLETYTDYYLQYKLDQVVQENRLVSLITLLRGTGSDTETQTDRAKFYEFYGLPL